MVTDLLRGIALVVGVTGVVLVGGCKVALAGQSPYVSMLHVLG
jgi:hypothetical protein